MRLFVSEYLTCGAWNGSELPPSLLAEGRAMLAAVVADFLADRDNQVRITCEAPGGRASIPSLWGKGGRSPDEGTRVVGADHVAAPSTPAPLPEDRGVRCFRSSPQHTFPDGLYVESVASTVEEMARFTEGLAWADAALIIAPETDGILARRCRSVVEANVASLNATPEAIELCGDKLLLYQHVSAADIPTPQTMLSGEAADLAGGDDRLYILKQRWGAGSQSMRLLSGSELQRVLSNEVFANEDPHAWVVQPFRQGRALSVAGLFDAGGSLRFLLPVAEQHLSDDGTFRYLGGGIPAEGVDVDAIFGLIERAGAAIAGLRGYIGFDLVVPRDPPEQPILIEINPRLTTSYIGYRSLCTQPLARWLIPQSLPADPPQFAGSVEFTVP